MMLARPARPLVALGRNAAGLIVAGLIVVAPDLARAELTPGTPAPDFPATQPWLNGPALSLKQQLKGKVVLVDFWEYTCINCIRTLPPFKKLYATYHGLGFEIIGVHAPEFDFAYRPGNVTTGTRRLRIPWPVVVDSEFKIWHAYDSNSWPNDFLIGSDGVIVHQHAGEGEYAGLENLIRQQLQKANPKVVLPKPVLGADPDTRDLARCGKESPETYVGAERGGLWGGAIANREGFQSGKTVNYASTPRPVRRGFYARGSWVNHGDDFEHARASKPLADYIGMHYEGAEVYAVMNVTSAAAHRLFVLRDGVAVPEKLRGVDVKVDRAGRTYIDVLEGRMYYLIQNEDGASHDLRLSPIDLGVRINSFTFGNRCLTDFDRL